MRHGLVLLFSLASTLVNSGRAEEPPPEPPITDSDRTHWAFVPVESPDLPPVEYADWCRTPIDRFVLARLEKKGLQPAPQANRRTLIRRLSFDLTGLPPTPREIRDFVDDPAPDAYEKLVDRLLASPGYGERWAQHWLDLARFSETDGFEHDKLRPEAWRYRDWVIRAFNEDLPYDRFLTLQIAADEVCPDDAAAQVATGFLLAGPDMPDINLQNERRHDFFNGMTATVGEIVLGLQMGCCQCHDHKADPISQYDFYRLRACFEPIDAFRPHHLTLPGDDGTEKAIPARIARVSSNSPTPRLWLRGDFRRPGPEVTPGVPRVAMWNPDFDVASARSRAALAEWMTHNRNPLTPRVMVNRVWQSHFGKGIVETPSDFGLMGYYPSHPELLDWLAAEFMRQDWRLKPLHRLIVTSAVYRTASRLEADPSAPESEQWQRLLEDDPTNTLFGRMPRRRLDGESIRDALLHMSGDLNRLGGGPGIRPDLPREVVATLLKNQWDVTPDRARHNCRSIYLFNRRNLRFPLFEAFDRPDPNVSRPLRPQTTIAPQALHLLNSDLTHQTSVRIAARIAPIGSVDDRITACFELMLGRTPRSDEIRRVHEFVASGGPDAWSDLCLAILNSNEFVYID